MNTVVAGDVPGRSEKLLVLLSVACFGLLTVSPMIAIGPVSMTKGASRTVFRNQRAVDTPDPSKWNTLRDHVRAAILVHVPCFQLDSFVQGGKL